jgi:hypothetical protein
MDFHGESGYQFHCRFHRQPQTDEELRQAISAIQVCCTLAVRYAGNDKTILDRIGCSQSCDALPESDGLFQGPPLYEG